MGKGSRLLTAGREWDGNVGAYLVDGTGRESTISWRDGTGLWNGSGTGREIGREHCRQNGREHSRGNGREHGREIGQERSRDMAERCSPEWLGTRSGTGHAWGGASGRSRLAGTIHLHNVHACHVLCVRTGCACSVCCLHINCARPNNSRQLAYFPLLFSIFFFSRFFCKGKIL